MLLDTNGSKTSRADWIGSIFLVRIENKEQDGGEENVEEEEDEDVDGDEDADEEEILICTKGHNYIINE